MDARHTCRRWRSRGHFASSRGVLLHSVGAERAEDRRRLLHPSPNRLTCARSGLARAPSAIAEYVGPPQSGPTPIFEEPLPRRTPGGAKIAAGSGQHLSQSIEDYLPGRLQCLLVSAPHNRLVGGLCHKFHAGRPRRTVDAPPAEAQELDPALCSDSISAISNSPPSPTGSITWTGEPCSGSFPAFFGKRKLSLRRTTSYPSV